MFGKIFRNWYDSFDNGLTGNKIRSRHVVTHLREDVILFCDFG